MSTSAAAFHVVQGFGASQQDVQITVTGSKVAVLGAGYVSGQAPASWLNIDMAGSGTSYVMHVGVAPAMSPGHYDAQFTVGTADDKGNVLSTRPFAVSLDIDPRMQFGTVPDRYRTYQFGDASLRDTLLLPTSGGVHGWTATSTADWLKVPATAQTGQGLNATVDLTGVAPGSYQGTVRVTNAEFSPDYDEVTYSINVTAASFAVAQDSMLFGGDDGRAALASLPVSMTLNAGTGIHPYTIGITTDTGGDWLHADHPSGTVGAAGATVLLSVDPAALVGGTYTGEVSVSTNVNGTLFSKRIPVTFNLEANRLVVTASGVALSRVGGRSVLSRKLRVLSALGKADTPWSAVSDQPWLSVTSSGNTGDELMLTATPGALAKDMTHIANVTITSSDPKVENQQSVRVGLYLSDAVPAAIDLQGFNALAFAASPVEPLVAIASGGQSSAFGFYDVYTGALVRPLNFAVATPGAMTFSEDGRSLFIFSKTNLNVVEAEVATGDYVRTYDGVGYPGSLEGQSIAVMHPNGYTILVTHSGRAYDLTTHDEIPRQGRYTMATNSALSLSVSPDQSMLLPNWGTPTRVIRTALDGGGLRADWPAVNTPTGRDNGDSCFAAAGDRLYTADQRSDQFVGISVTTSQIIQRLQASSYVDALLCVWNGLVISGSDDYYSMIDVHVFDGPSGLELTTLNSDGTTYFGHYRDLLHHGLVVSGDGTRLVSAWNGSQQQISSGMFIQSLPTPP